MAIIIILFLAFIVLYIVSRFVYERTEYLITYELDNKKDFIKEFGIDIIELSDAIRKIMYDEHTDKKFEHYKFFILRSAERIGEIIANE